MSLLVLSGAFILSYLVWSTIDCDLDSPSVTQPSRLLQNKVVGVFLIKKNEIINFLQTDWGFEK